MRNPTRRNAPSKKVWSRRCAAQALYEWQLTGGEPAWIAAGFLAHQDLGKADLEYFRELVGEIPLHVAEIDAALAPFLDRPLAQVDPVECAILRIGGYELMKRPEINHRVAINEAVELAKMFGAEQGHRFVNGVLDKLARTVRPGEFTQPS